MLYFMFTSFLGSYPRLGLLPLLGSALLLAQCKKKEVEPQLPPETTTGAMTFGCKVDGHVFTPRNGQGQEGLYVQYVNLGTGPQGGCYLNIPAADWKATPIKAVSITTDSLLVEEGKTYAFKNSKGTVHAFYAEGGKHQKLDSDEGELTITRFDATQRILSGRFHFVGTNQTTRKQVRVTEGRFDVRF
ncbi:DUF6252 family protein [Hymenobacter sublimis]|uniref:DUF6252 family protein n=1 Tax=Hymenobacter sublimis TaxID=2933777 RepID=A0ABY4JH50_9BACT|nr:DUF6252 family protein [Hymenobacter sublimis]